MIALNDIVQQVERKVGKIGRVGRKSTYNPRTKKYFGFADNYVPDPVHYRADLWGEVGLRPTTWDNISRAAPRLKAMGNPIGIGMSQELDSNMALIALLQCFGAFIQNPEARITIKSKGTRDALNFMRDLYRRGMTSEVFAWTAASNNDAFLAGRLSMAMNAISIARSAEQRNVRFNRDIRLLPIPDGPGPRMGLEHVMGVYVIWKFAQNKRAARKFLLDIGTQYTGHFLNSYFYNFPAFPGSVKNIPARLRRNTSYPNEVPGRYPDPGTHLQELDDERRSPRLLERGDRRGLQQVHHPADVRPGRPRRHVRGRGDACSASRDDADLQEVAGPQEDLAGRMDRRAQGRRKAALPFWEANPPSSLLRRRRTDRARRRRGTS